MDWMNVSSVASFVAVTRGLCGYCSLPQAQLAVSVTPFWLVSSGGPNLLRAVPNEKRGTKLQRGIILGVPEIETSLKGPENYGLPLLYHPKSAKYSISSYPQNRYYFTIESQLGGWNECKRASCVLFMTEPSMKLGHCP